MKKRFVFVYGTLKMGFGNHAVIRHGTHSSLITSTALTGYEMRSVSGCFPAIRQVNDPRFTVRGELYEIVDDSVMGGLDSLEGYSSEHPEHSMYLRRTVDPADFDVDIPSDALVETYVWADPEDFNGMERIADGTWK